MKALFLTCLIATATLGSLGKAHANLLGSGCSTTASLETSSLVQYASADDFHLPEVGVMVAGLPGLTCQQLIQFDNAAGAIRTALIPLQAALMVPSVNSYLAAEAAVVGATIAASPAILAVTAVGAVGIVTTYIVVHASIEQCKEMEPARLKAELFRELESRYGLKALKSLPLEFQN
jgi:hypothetical protein